MAAAHPASEPFVRAVNPSVAVFSVQRDSRFGHPHPMVVERYKALGVHVFRTDEHGAITVRTDGQSVWVDPLYRRASGARRPSDPPPGGDTHATYGRTSVASRSMAYNNPTNEGSCFSLDTERRLEY